MSEIEQILRIKKFFASNEETIIINHVNEEIWAFYFGILKFFAKKQRIKLDIVNSDEKTENINDLFGLKEIKIYSITNTKKLTPALEEHCKKIIFTDYKNYKKLNSKYNCISGYKFEIDITFFIKNELKIDNEDLLHFCRNNPALLMSEISKYLINHDLYTSDQVPIEDKNHILDIRKSIFEIKKDKINIKNLYLYLKKEAKYKKLSFLTY